MTHERTSSGFYQEVYRGFAISTLHEGKGGEVTGYAASVDDAVTGSVVGEEVGSIAGDFGSIEEARAFVDAEWNAHEGVSIITAGGIVTECQRVTVDEQDGYAVHGDPTEGFYPTEDVLVLDTEDEQRRLLDSQCPVQSSCGSTGRSRDMAHRDRTATNAETAEVLAGMFTENTGRHMLDSGGAYGRMWERNAGMTAADFLAREGASIRIERWGSEPDEWSVDVTLDAFHFCYERLTYAPEIDALFQRYCTFIPELREASWTECIAAFTEALERRDGHTGDEYWRMGENTYNGDSLLSQILQYEQVPTEQFGGAILVFLQVHGGCDARGGYTKPRVFFCNPDAQAMYDHNRATLYFEQTDFVDGQLYLNGRSAYPRSIRLDIDGGQFENVDGGQFDVTLLTVDESDLLHYEGFPLRAVYPL